MIFNDLPNDLKEKVIEIKCNSCTINCELEDALDKADNYEEFKEIFKNKMYDLISEIRDAIRTIFGE